MSIQAVIEKLEGAQIRAAGQANHGGPSIALLTLNVAISKALTMLREQEPVAWKIERFTERRGWRHTALTRDERYLSNVESGVYRALPLVLGPQIEGSESDG